jgi:iron-sulfur cluster assembly protein
MEAFRDIIRVTPVALARLLELSLDVGDILLSVVSKGCTGLSYKLSVCDDISTGVDYTDLENYRLYFPSRDVIYMFGLEIDYKHDVAGSRFIFFNPAFPQTCGCGESFRQ